MARANMLLVEDDAALAELLNWHFDREDFDVRQTPDGEEALLLAQERTPDIVLLDWMVENLSGIEVCRRLRRMPETSNVPIIMLTARGEEEDRVRGLETGADDYVTSPFSPASSSPASTPCCAACVRRWPARCWVFGDLEMDTVAHKVRRGGEVIPLGPTEFRLLRHLLEHPGWGLLARAAARQRLGQDSEIELRTVDVHIRRLRKAINVGERPDIIRTVRSAGYSLDADGGINFVNPRQWESIPPVGKLISWDSRLRGNDGLTIRRLSTRCGHADMSCSDARQESRAMKPIHLLAALLAVSAAPAYAQPSTWTVDKAQSTHSASPASTSAWISAASSARGTPRSCSIPPISRTARPRSFPDGIGQDARRDRNRDAYAGRRPQRRQFPDRAPSRST